MADRTDNESITEVVAETLGKYLVDQISDLEDYYPEFPQVNRDLRMPSVSIITATSDFRPLSPYKLPVNPANISNNQSLVTWVVGIWDLSVQVDLWTRNKEERDDLFDALFNALNPDITPMGLRLTMEEYFGQIIEFSMNGQEFGDGEQASQTDEWRSTITLLATCKAIRTRTEFMITDTPTASEIENEVGSEISPTVVVE